MYLTDLSTDVRTEAAIAVVDTEAAAAERWTGDLYRNIFKPVLDVLLVVLTLATSIPVILFLAALVAIDGHNPFYTQMRVGRNGKPFRIWKLRTMVPDAERILQSYLASNPAARLEWDATQKLRNDPRVTRVGRLLRKTSLDELPQLINVLNGTMSLVGPRPMLLEQQALYPGRSYYRLRPGITGSWQVSDRNDCNFVDRAPYDDRYDQSLSFRTDLSILVRTVAVVLRRTGC